MSQFTIEQTAEKNLDVSQTERLDQYASAEMFIAANAPLSVDELREMQRTEPLSHHILVIDSLSFFLYVGPSSDEILIVSPEINCSISALNALRLQVFMDKFSNGTENFKIYTSNNGLVPDYIDHAENFPDEIYHLKSKQTGVYRDSSDYLVLSAIGLFCNDNMRRTLIQEI